MFVPPVQSHASALALELGNKIAGLIQEFKQSHPGTSGTDIRNALKIAETQAGTGKQKQLVLALITGLLLLGGLAVFFFVSNSGSGGPPRTMMPMIIGGLILMGLVVMVVSKK